MELTTQLIVVFALGFFIGRYVKLFFLAWAVKLFFKIIKHNPKELNKYRNRFQDKLHEMMDKAEKEKD